MIDHPSPLCLPFCPRVARRQRFVPSLSLRSCVHIFGTVLRWRLLPLVFCSSSLLWIILGRGEMYRTTDNYIFRHACLLCRATGCGNRGPFPRRTGGERSRRWKIHVGDLGCLTCYNWLLLASYLRGPTRSESNESFVLFKPRDFSR